MLFLLCFSLGKRVLVSDLVLQKVRKMLSVIDSFKVPDFRFVLIILNLIGKMLKYVISNVLIAI